MKCSEVLLQAARKIGLVVDGSATETGSTTTLTDSGLKLSQEGGVLFITGGDNAGEVRRVDQVDNNAVMISTALTSMVASGDGYALGDVEYDLLLNAARSVFGAMRYMAIDETLTVVADQEFYTMPEGVEDVRRVEVARESSEPYEYQEHHYWEEAGGELRFRAYRPQTADRKIRICYVTRWAFEAEGDLPDGLALFLAYFAWAIAADYWRQYLRIHKQDEPLAIEMMNEAKMNEAREARPQLTMVKQYGRI